MVPLIDGMLGAVIPARTWFGALMSIIGVGMLECSGSSPCVSFYNDTEFKHISFMSKCKKLAI